MPLVFLRIHAEQRVDLYAISVQNVARRFKSLLPGTPIRSSRSPARGLPAPAGRAKRAVARPFSTCAGYRSTYRNRTELRAELLPERRARRRQGSHPPD
jgi:hypothetical protein